MNQETKNNENGTLNNSSIETLDNYNSIPLPQSKPSTNVPTTNDDTNNSLNNLIIDNQGISNLNSQNKKVSSPGSYLNSDVNNQLLNNAYGTSVGEIPNINNSNNQIVNNGINSNLGNQNGVQVQTPNPNMDLSYNSINNLSPQKPKNNLIKYLLISLALLVLIGLIVFGVSKLFHKTPEVPNIQDMTSSDVFFLPKSKDYATSYALFNTDGKQLTDFIYNDDVEFFNGVASVEKGDEYALIDTTGKEIVKFGDYNFLSSSYSGLYKALDDEGYEYLLNNKGEKIYTYNKDEKISEIYELSDLYSYVVDGKKITLFNYKGQKIKEYTLEDKDAVSSSSLDNLLKDYNVLNKNFGNGYEKIYSSVYYNGELTILDNVNCKEYLSLKTSTPYKLRDVIYNDKTIFLEESENDKYAVIYDKKLKELNYKSIGVDNEILTGKNDFEEHVINPDGTEGILITYDTEIMDLNNYVIQTDTWSADFYVNNKKVKNADVNIHNAKNGIYIVGLNDENHSETMYDVNGNRVLNESYYSVYFPDSNERIIASKGRNDGEFLIDKTGKQVSEKYDSIKIIEINEKESEYYIIEKDNKEGVIDKDGKVVIELKYNDIEKTQKTDNDLLFLTKLEDNSHEIISFKKGVILTSKYLNIEDNYIRKYIEDNNKNEYYTFSGEKFYTV